MPGRFKFEKLAKYPHMKPEDVVVWERFITKNPDFFDTVDYDVALGEGAPQDPSLPENIARDGKILTQKKIDVVGYKGNDVSLVEVKPIANMRGLGQIITYFKLYEKPEDIAGVVFKVIVAGAVERELDDVFKENDVLLMIA